MPDKSKSDAGKPGLRRSLVLSFAQKYTGFLITLPTIMILSRLLTPAQIGVFSIAMSVVGLIHMLRDFGISDFIVQHPKVEPDVVRSTFTVNLIVAWLLGISLFALSKPLGSFYSEPGLREVLRVLSGNFFLMPFGSTRMALMTRHMQFGRLYVINTVQTLVRGGLAIALAFLGMGYMSLAWAALAAMAASVLASVIVGSAYRMHGLGLSRWRDVTRFGLIRVTGDTVNKAGMRSADIVIGRVLGMTAAGLYSRGYGLVNMFRSNVVGAVNAATFPAFADHHREKTGPDALFLRSLTFLTGVAWPFLLFAAIMAFPIIRIAFGSQWDAAVPLLRWLAVAAMVGTLMFQCSHYFTAIGRVGISTRNQVWLQSIRVVIVVFAAFQGLQAVAAAQVLVYALGVVIFYKSMLAVGGLSIMRILRAVRSSAVVTLTSAIGPVLVYYFLMPRMSTIWLPFVIACVSATGGWILGVYWTGHPLWGEFQHVLSRLWRRWPLHSSA